jgi:hypothetical protein
MSVKKIVSEVDRKKTTQLEIRNFFDKTDKTIALLDDPTDTMRLMELADHYVVLCRANNVESEHDLTWTSQTYRKHIELLQNQLFTQSNK